MAYGTPEHAAWCQKMREARAAAKARKVIIAVIRDESPAVEHYWTGSGLSRDMNRAKRFADREGAFVEWNEHSVAFPGWEARMESAA